MNSEFDATLSSFIQNISTKGGVIFAIQNSLMNIRESLLTGNRATDGGILYAMANKISSAVTIKTTFIKIYGEDGKAEASLVL